MIINFGIQEYLFLFIISEIIVGLVLPFIIIKEEREKIIELKLYSLVGFILYVLVGMTFIVILSSISYYYSFGLFNYNLGYDIGFILFIIGIILQGIAEATLGKYYLPSIGTVEGQKIVKDGIYKYIRHPGYLGEIIIFFGLGFVTYSLLGILGAFIVSLMVYVGEVIPEEKYMLQKFGKEYEEYMKETFRFIPYIF
ncbi:methyltransferase family protein [Candidatus Nanobsidianus stetteri]|uniref:Isoprenylcysteine carboxylmethyltransferase family protein n=1 Tax=Nanobsidianus stetteri TaxID=1294122 RepID=A0A2T9WLD0_NANST|nr:isoprenylcysteine carboxylmethyltransferase family protein [Candidatus Nanobsidianus stetteri]MCC5447178.1 isoprenylcysteine carboxylmethyltransferase family protein [Candidatus Nanobsidianus stetteri]